MFDSNTTIGCVISVDTQAEAISFFTPPVSGHANNHVAANYRSRPFDEEFFQKFDKILKIYRQKNPTAQLGKVSVILPDHVFLTDTLRIPNLGKKAVEHSLKVAVGAVYKNVDELQYNTFPLAQNKQFATYGLVGVRKDLLEKINEVCRANQVGVQNITFASNALVNGAITLNNKLKAENFLLLDIKEDKALFAFVNKGRTIGSYSLPFGYSMLYKSRLASEDLLFDHTTAELLVLNAKERAKAKQLTMMGEEIMVDPDAQEQPQSQESLYNHDEEFELGAEGGKRSARKLPKSMQRELPTDREGFVYENFRIFLKWTLDLLAGNGEITALGEIDTVYVNMPKELAFLYDMINAEEEENKVKFAPLFTGGGRDMEAANAKKLELYGGFFVKQYNKLNNF